MSQDEGRLEAIWIKRMKRGPMDPQERATLVEGQGIEGNANQGGKRQVTILSGDIWDQMMKELGQEVPPASRRANLLVRGVDLADSRSKVLAIGRCRIRIYGETRPCERMDESLDGLTGKMKTPWNGGAFGEVIEGGTIAVGDSVEWSED